MSRYIISPEASRDLNEITDYSASPKYRRASIDKTAVETDPTQTNSMPSGMKKKTRLQPPGIQPAGSGFCLYRRGF